MLFATLCLLSGVRYLLVDGRALLQFLRLKLLASRCHRRQTFVRLTQSLSFRNERIRRHFVNQKFFSGVETDRIEAYKFTSSIQKRTL